MSLTDDLNSYLKKTSSGSSSGSSLTNLASKLKLPSLKSPFGDAGSVSEDQQPFLENNESPSSGGGGSWFGSKAAAGSSGPAWLPALSRKQRIFGFMTSIILGLICFGLASAYIPFIVLKARKFSLLFSLGSMFTITSFSFLYGPWNHVMTLLTKERLPFTLVYFGTLIGTLYFAMGLQSTILTCIAAAVQIVALVWFVVSYVPGGQTGLKFFSKLCSGLCRSSANSANLPI